MSSRTETSPLDPQNRFERGKILWEIADRVGSRAATQPVRNAFKVLALATAALLSLVAVVQLGSAVGTAISHRAATGDMTTALCVGATCIVLAAFLNWVSATGRAYTPVPKAIRGTRSFVRMWGAALAYSLTLAAVVVIVFGYVKPADTSNTLLIPACLFTIAGRVGWWMAREHLPALLPIDTSEPNFYRVLSLALRWSNTGVLVFTVLAYVATTLRVPQLIAVSVLVTIVLALLARATADRGAVSASVARLEQALTKTYVALDRYRRKNANKDTLPALQEAMLELGAAATNDSISRLPDKYLRTDPSHLVMLSFLTRELARVEVTSPFNVDAQIRQALKQRNLSQPVQLAEVAADYILDLRDRLTMSQAQLNLAEIQAAKDRDDRILDMAAQLATRQSGTTGFADPA